MSTLIDELDVLFRHWTTQIILTLHIGRHGEVEEWGPADGLREETETEEGELMGFLGHGNAFHRWTLWDPFDMSCSQRKLFWQSRCEHGLPCEATASFVIC